MSLENAEIESYIFGITDRFVLCPKVQYEKPREDGGAYGCMSSFMRNGDCYFVSYRDPNLQKTVEVYENASTYIKSFVADERTLTQYIIGTISDMDAPLSPAAYGAYSLSAYLSEVTDEMIQKDRDEVLNVTEADIRKLADYVEAVLEDNCVCVVGTAPKIEESKECCSE